jgi:putative membrane protein
MDDAQIRAIERPHKSLLVFYAIMAIPSLFLWPIVMLPLYFKYHTLRYKFDDEGISASWGILFHRQIFLTYKRIQDIHVQRNLVERWLGIGRVQIQTASGSAGAELTIEGLKEHEAVRDYLYTRMRGHGKTGGSAPQAAAGLGAGEPAAAPSASEAEMVALLQEIRAELAATRAALEGRGS